MILIKSIKVVNDIYLNTKLVLPKKIEFKCSSINLIVGDQGSGKSTLLKELINSNSDIEVELATNDIDTLYFNNEFDNPRIKPRLSSTNGAYELYSQFRSHGEVLKELVIEPLRTTSNKVILLDEPESGLSIRSQYELIKELHKTKNQVFIVTHSPLLIEEFHFAYSMDKYKFMTKEQIMKYFKTNKSDKSN